MKSKKQNAIFTRDQYIAIAAVLVPIIILALVFLFKSIIEHEIIINNNTHKVEQLQYDERQNQKENNDARRRVFLYLDDRLKGKENKNE